MALRISPRRHQQEITAGIPRCQAAQRLRLCAIQCHNQNHFGAHQVLHDWIEAHPGTQRARVMTRSTKRPVPPHLPTPKFCLLLAFLVADVDLPRLFLARASCANIRSRSHVMTLFSLGSSASAISC